MLIKGRGLRRRRKQPGQNPGGREKLNICQALRGPLRRPSEQRSRTRSENGNFMGFPKVTQPGHSRAGLDGELDFAEHQSSHGRLLSTYCVPCTELGIVTAEKPSLF